MKQKLTARKIVLASIGVLSALLLLISMSLFYVYFPSASKKETVLGMTAENGFSMLSFQSFLDVEKSLEFSGVLMGVTSCLMLIGVISGLALTVFPLFFCDEKKAEILSTVSIIFNACIAIIYLIVGIIVVFNTNGVIKETEGVDTVKALLCSTATFWAVIFQAIILTAYILCSQFIKKEKIKVESKEAPEKAGVKPMMSGAEKEKKIIELLREYKDIYCKGIITIMDFEKKKYALMFDNKYIDFEEESRLVEALVAYKKICDEEIITHDEYEKKKLQILATK